MITAFITTTVSVMAMIMIMKMTMNRFQDNDSNEDHDNDNGLHNYDKAFCLYYCEDSHLYNIHLIIHFIIVLVTVTILLSLGMLSAF